MFFGHLPASGPRDKALKSIQPNRPWRPVQPKRERMAIGRSAATRQTGAIRVVKSQAIELVRRKPVKIVPKVAMHASANETGVIRVRVHPRAQRQTGRILLT